MCDTSEHAAACRHGELLEQGPVKQVFDAPEHQYTQMLLEAIPHPLPRRHRSMQPAVRQASDAGP